MIVNIANVATMLLPPLCHDKLHAGHEASNTTAVGALGGAGRIGRHRSPFAIGLYYAAKICGACDLTLFDKTGDAKQQASAMRHLEAALNHWRIYSAGYTRQYVQPVSCNRAGLVDLPKQAEDVTVDVQMARDWKPGTIDETQNETQIKRSGTEAGFRK